MTTESKDRRGDFQSTKHTAGLAARSTFKVMASILIVLFALECLLVLVIPGMVTGFADRHVEKELEEARQTLQKILAGDRESLWSRIQSGKTLEAIERFARDRKLDVLVFKDEKTLLAGDLPFDVNEIREVEQRERTVPPMQFNHGKYYARSFPFAPREWRIVLLKEAPVLTGLAGEIRRVCIIGGILLLAAALLLAHSIQKIVQDPMNAILARLGEQESPPSREPPSREAPASDHSADRGHDAEEVDPGRYLELVRLDRELREARAEADAARRAKSDFVANMSHEVRTPMNAIVGLTHLALQTRLSKKQLDYLSKIQFSASSLLGIIDDILDFSKIEAGKLTIDYLDFDLNDVLEKLSNMLNLKAEQKGVELLIDIAPDAPVFLAGDPMRLGQVLINLADNALKFTDKGEIRVSTELAESPAADETPDEALLKFKVRDTGVGIPHDKIDVLFKSFSQANGSTTRIYGGAGLGLAICKRLVEMMGGEIGVESEIGKGSVFWFTSRFGIQADKRDACLAPDPDLSGLRVLVVDDNATSREILNNIMRSFSFEVTMAVSGEDALRELEKTVEEDGEKPYDLILMDWKMPGMDGIETSLRIKKNENLPRTPIVIMITVHDREELVVQAHEAGLDAFLAKPVNPPTLYETILEAFGRKITRMPRVSQQRGVMDAEALRGIHGASVLLVEDNEINQQVARELLENAGFLVTVARHGKEAVEAVEESDFELVFMDIQMPVMDGHEATRRIRAAGKARGDAYLKNLPIVAMTAHAMKSDVDKCLSVGMNDHIAKPIDPDKLFSTLVKWIDTRKREPAEDGLPWECPPGNGYEEIPVLPGIDVKSALQRMMWNQRLFKKLLREFHRDYSDAAETIREALARGDIKAAGIMAHTVRGVGGNFSAVDLYGAAHELELAIEQGRKVDFDSRVNDFEAELRRVLASIENIGQEKKEPTPVGGAPVDPAIFKVLLSELAILLEANDMDAEELMASIMQQANDVALRNEFKKLADQISRLEFEKAQHILAGITENLGVQV